MPWFALVLACSPELSAADSAPPEWQPWTPLRVAYRPGHVVVSEEGPATQEVSLALTGWGTADRLRSVGIVAPARIGGRQVYAHPGLSEWWETTPEGLEQGFLVEEVPSGGPLVVELALSGATAVVDQDARSATLVPEGGRGLRYQDLVAWDADGDELPARMEATSQGLRLVVDTDGASAPITIDPLLPGTAWSDEGDQQSSSFGGIVASAGDVDGDGFDELLVGSYRHDGAFVNEGAAFLYPGSAAGLSVAPTWMLEGGQTYAFFGAAVGSAGDVNADGFDDVVVGAHNFDNGQTDEGRAYLFLGSAAGLATVPAWTVESNQAYSNFALKVVSAGDVNGDGYSDVAVGAYRYDLAQADEGAVFVYHGSAAGLPQVPSWSALGDQPGGYFGRSVASAGDVNGDGYSDLVIGSNRYSAGERNEGGVFVYLGSPNGLASVPAWTLESDQAGAELGKAVAGAGDVNGDGYSDVIVGAFTYDHGQTDEGSAALFLGSPGGLANVPAWTAESDQADALFGECVASVGDLNGDGYGDVGVGAYDWDGGQLDEGAAWVYLGSAAGLSRVPVVRLEGDSPTGGFGGSMATAGDVNGDGIDDLVVGSSGFTNDVPHEGAAFLYLGR